MAVLEAIKKQFITKRSDDKILSFVEVIYYEKQSIKPHTEHLPYAKPSPKCFATIETEKTLFLRLPADKSY